MNLIKTKFYKLKIEIMKKINLMIIAVLASALAFMTSCDNGSETITPKPVITFTSDHSGVVMAGDSVDVVGSVEAEGSLEKITFFKGDDQYGDAITSDFNTKTTHTFSVRVAGEETFNFEVQVEDKEGQVSKKSVTITVDESIVKSSESVKIYCASADQTGYGDYASLTTFETWNHNEAENNADTIANTDVCYYNGNYTKTLGGTPHLVSPDACPIAQHSGVILTNAKSTKFLVLTDATAFADFSNIEDDTAIKAIDMANAVANVGDFAEGDVIAFELADGKMGVIKAVGGTAGYGNDDYILVDVIVQKHAPATK